MAKTITVKPHKRTTPSPNRRGFDAPKRGPKTVSVPGYKRGKPKR